MLGWAPDRFWSAQLWECRTAYLTFSQHEQRRDARQAARLINGMRVAFHADNFDEFTVDDFLGENGPGAEDIEQAREEFSETFPSTLDTSPES